MKIDSHMHTPLCGHAIGNPIEYVEAAARQGLERITFTCHIPLKPSRDFGGSHIRMKASRLGKYRKMVTEAASRGRDLGVEVLYGIEAEIFPDREVIARVEEIIQSEPFDFVLGSLHHQMPGYHDWLEKNGDREDSDIICSYFRHLTDGVRSGLYDSIAHPDVIRIYGTVDPFDPREYKEEIEEFLDALVEKDHCMEVNTSGLIKGVFEVHPAPVILEWARERDIRLTMGSDAHHPGQVGQFFPEVSKYLVSLGYNKIHYFEKRERREVLLADMLA